VKANTAPNAAAAKPSTRGRGPTRDSPDKNNSKKTLFSPSYTLDDEEGAAPTATATTTRTSSKRIAAKAASR
jgi:hypothetical protein